MLKTIRRLKSEEDGAVTIIVALLLVILFGFMGLAVDVSYAFYIKTKMQGAADAAALGAASDLAHGGSAIHALGVATSLATSNGFTTGTSDTTVIPAIPPGANPDGSSPSYANDTSYARVQIVQNTPLFFAPVMGISKTWPISANAVAGIKNSPDCLVTVAGFNINGNNTASLNNCSAAIGGNLRATNKANISVIGTGSISVYNNGSIDCTSCSPKPTSRSSSLPSLPTVTIPAGLSVVSDSCATRTCSPGIYNTKLTLTKGASYTFSSGFYVFNGGISTNSAIVTSSPGGVTLYVGANQPIDLSGSLTLNAQTPSGCSAGSGVLIHQAPSSTSSMSLAGSKDQLNFTGIVNLPYTDITISGTSSNFTLSGSLIAHSLDLNGNMNPSASSNPCNNFVSTNNVSLYQ